MVCLHSSIPISFPDIHTRATLSDLHPVFSIFFQYPECTVAGEGVRGWAGIELDQEYGLSLLAYVGTLIAKVLLHTLY
jgi:hypothetical protein